MTLSALAEYKSDLSEMGARAAVCFTAARCAGADVKSIAPAARAAVLLGADWKWLHADGPAYLEDTQYLDECESIRHAIAARRQEVTKLLHEAEGWMYWAEREMTRAIRTRDWPRYLAALEVWFDASHAMSVCRDTISKLDGADRALAHAPYRYHDVYEEPVNFAAKGGLLPHEGRWITGEKHRPTVRWLG